MEKGDNMHFSMGGFISHQLSLKRVFQKKKDRDCQGKRYTETEKYVVYLDQLLGARSFFSDFTAEINKKHLKMNKKMFFFAYSSKLV